MCFSAISELASSPGRGKEGEDVPPLCSQSGHPSFIWSAIIHYQDIFCASHHGSHLSLSSHMVSTCVMTGTGRGVYQVKGISVSPREGYPPQAKFVVSMASLSWELNLVREDYLICNTPSWTRIK